MNDDETNEKCKNDEISNFDLDEKNSSTDLNKLNCDDNSNYTQQHVQHRISHFQRQQQISSPIENRCIIDKDGLVLALKYFTSSTLTMRLSGIAQINSYISLFNEYLQSEISSLRQSEGEQFVDWILSNKIIEHIFGPNLHVEVIKQSQIILNFVVSHLTPQQIDVIWSASQLKHCSKQVFDILMPLIKNMNVTAVLHLYSLLKNLDVKEHTEQTLCLASCLLKYIWAKSFNIVEPSSHKKSNSKRDSALMKKNFINIFRHSNYDFFKGVSDDSSVSASIVDTSEEEEEVVSTFYKNPPIDNRLGDSISSCASQISLEEENKQEENILNNEVLKTRQVFNSPKFKNHYHLPPPNFQLQSLSTEFLEKKKLDNTSSSDSELEVSQVDKNLIRKNRLNEKNFPCFEKTHLKIVDEEEDGDEEDLFESEEEQSCLLLSQLMKMKKNIKISNNLGQPVNSILSDSNSSQFSEKNMADFDGEESDASESDQVELSQQNQQLYDRIPTSPNELSLKKNYHSLINLANLQNANNQSINSNNSLMTCGLNENSDSYESEITAELIKFSLENVCKPGQTLLWDILHDDSIKFLSEGLAQNCEKILFNLICWLSDKRLRMKFIEGCMDNIFQNKSVIISLRLLPKLLMSFDQQRGKPEIHALTLMVEKDRNLLKCFFSNLVQYSEKYKYYSKLKFEENDLQSNTKESSSQLLNKSIDKLKEEDKNEKTKKIKKTQICLESTFKTDLNFDQSSYEFFNNMLYSHQEEIQTRLHFLSIIFSSTCSPDQFQLSKEQIDILWYCIAYDFECRDELFSWLLNQVRTKEQHALSNEMLEYIFVKKMPTLTPDSYTMVALELLQSLCNNIFIKKQQELFNNKKFEINNEKKDIEAETKTTDSKNNLSSSSSSSSLIANNQTEKESVNFFNYNDQWGIASVAIKQLWDIALKAINTDVSMAAIRHLNNYYVHLQSPKTLDKEEEFIKQCMDYLTISSKSLKEEEEKNLTVIQRALILLKTHLETFRCRYSFHFRLMQLNGNTSITSHRNKLNERLPQQVIKIICQPSALNEKIFEMKKFEMNLNDYVGELRAEIINWWTKLINKIKSDTELIGISNKKISSLALEGPIRLLSQGQELSYNFDEKTLVEMNFKDGQVVYLTIGVNRQKRKESIELNSKLPDPPKNKLPSILLLNPIYFDQLFNLLQQLGSMKETICAGRAQVLSRRVWEIINLLPTSPNLMKCFKNICLAQTSSKNQDLLPSLNTLLDPKSPQKLIYSLQIVDYLQKVKNDDISSGKENNWLKYFVDYGGLNHLFEIFTSGVLQQGESDIWNEWKQDCLASLLQLIYQIGVNSFLSDDQELEEKDLIKIQPEPNCRKKKNNRLVDKLIVHQFNKKFLAMLTDIESVLKVILTILNETCSISACDNVYQTGFWGRAQIVHHTFIFLTSWLFSNPSIHVNLFNSTALEELLKKLVLEDPDSSVRKEICSCLYRLCLGNSKNSKIGYLFIPHLLNILLNFLPIAQKMKPIESQVSEEICYIEKDSFGPGCKDYFWIICTLVDSLEPDYIGTGEGKVDLEKLCVYLATSIENLEIRETRNLNVEDEGLRGLLCLMSVSLKHNPPYKKNEKCKLFLHTIFDCLFAHPNSNDRNLPKCKQQSTRSAAFDLLIEIIKGCEENHTVLINLLYKQHTLSSHNTYIWDYWPHDDCRSDCGYVGLINLGATCYMASCVQHLFMFPQVRKVILKSKISKNTKNSAVLYELQRMFAFLMESERKAYNPKNFCKVYTMDNQPLNTGEQKDMTEFFTDLISKLEDMSNELKDTLRELFAGTLSNNVVSLDCPHISRTTEEFYTLRCKVADMRNLYDSLDELTVKDTLEGDNMYTCSQCGKKVRAEKRACLKKLPEILCLNTLRYTFNMVTMTKEKVNTHFSFPMKIDLSPYLEENLIRNDDKTSKKLNESTSSDFGPENQFATSQTASDSRKRSKEEKNLDESNEYELIGVTVHTGTADGGHYYCFIREPDSSKGKDKWYIFNDAEVHSFDPNQLAAECFGGEMTSKTYDSVNDKFMDFAIEKTNSAYMLFYKRIPQKDLFSNSSIKNEFLCGESSSSSQSIKLNTSIQKVLANNKQSEIVYEISKELNDWIWEDNIQFIKDKYIFEHTYFHFMWQVCSVIPQTVNNSQKIMLLSAQLATAFVIETLIHSKEKPTIANWIELLTKQFNASLEACEWLIDHIAENYLHWPVQILLKCPNQMVRQLFQRLCVHVITELKKTQQNLYLKSSKSSENLSELKNETNIDSQNSETNEIKNSNQSSSLDSIDNLLPDFGKFSCVTRLIRKLLILIKCNNQLVRPHLKHLSEYFNLLYEFTKMGEIECEFMLKMETISIIVQFYLSHCKANGEILEMISEDEEDFSEIDEEQIDQQIPLDQLNQANCSNASNSSPNFDFYRNSQIIGSLAQSFKELQQEKYSKPISSLDKIISFTAFLVEKSRVANGKLLLSSNDMEALVGKSFAFLHRQIRDNINLRQTFNLICTLCLNNEKMSTSILNMILSSINRQPETSQPFFIILSMLVELSNNNNQQSMSPSTSVSSISIPSFSTNIYPKIWEIAEQNPLHCLEWLTTQVPRNVNLYNIILKDLNKWIEYFLIAHNNQRVRHATAHLIISLVPNNLFRQTYKTPKPLIPQSKENLELTEEAILVVRKIFSNLLGLLKTARSYADIQTHGTSKLTSYFALMFYCLLSNSEKLMLVPYFNDLWNLFQPKLSEPAVPINQNKQALLYFWYQACIDCPENVFCIIQNSQVTKNIAFNYILADHDDQDVVLFNRIMLPSYYGLLRLCCMHSKAFTRQLAMHQNLIWAFKNITPYYTQYQSAVNELFKLMRLFIAVNPDTTEQELEEIQHFKRSTILTYLNSIDPRSCWTTLITAFKILLENDDDRIFAIVNNVITSLFQSFNSLFMMFHEATACHITNEIVDLLKIISSLLSTLYKNIEQPEMQEYLKKWKDHSEYIKKPIHLLNTYTPTEVRLACMDLLFELIQLFPKECIPVSVQILGLGHLSFQEQFMNFAPGPYFPRLGQRAILSKSSLRPSRPVFQMHFHPKILQANFGKDKTYDDNLKEYYLPYYNFIASLCKIANDNRIVNQELIGFSSIVALESLTMHINVFPKLWLELNNSGNGDDFINMLCISCNYFKEYVCLILTQEKTFLQDESVFNLMKICLSKINPSLINNSFISKIILSDYLSNKNFEDISSVKKFQEILGYLRAIIVLMSDENIYQTLNDEQKAALIKIKEKSSDFHFDTNSSNSDMETPQKKRKHYDESSTDENESCSKNDNLAILHQTKNELKNLIGKAISDLIKLIKFES